MNDMMPETLVPLDYRAAIQNIRDLNWEGLSRDDLTQIAWAYYFFSIQFRENLQIACRLHPDDAALQRLLQEECETANLSPWLDVAANGEALNHDEFMLRLLRLNPINPVIQSQIERLGRDYLTKVHAIDDETRAASIASYEDGGLETVFRAILRAGHWQSTPLLAAFHHFLIKHISFDSDPEQGHGALSRHLIVDDRVSGLWSEFYVLLVGTVPRLIL